MKAASMFEADEVKRWSGAIRHEDRVKRFSGVSIRHTGYIYHMLVVVNLL